MVDLRLQPAVVGDQRRGAARRRRRRCRSCVWRRLTAWGSSHGRCRMDYVKLGRTGLDVSRLCLGCMTFGVPDRGTHPWTLDEEQSRPIIRRAVELGINFFDTANSYSDGTSEEIIGRAAARDGAPRRDRRRHQGVLPDRGQAPNGRGLSRKAIFQAIDASLRRLGMDYVDLYQIHRWDYRTPIEETLEALHDVVKAGKVRYLGASSMFAWQFATALQVRDAARLDALRHDAEPLQPALSRGGARDAAALPRRGHRRDAVEPAGARPADARLERDDRRARRPTRSARSSTPVVAEADRAGRRARSPRWRRRAACRGRRSRWRGCCSSPASPRRSSAPRATATSRTRWPRSHSG